MNRVIWILFILLCSCSVKEYDQLKLPTLHECDNTLADASAHDLRSWCARGARYISSDMVFSGVVVANDLGGNFNKRFIVDGSRGGVEVLAGFYSLSTNYPVGRNIHIRLKGLTIELREGVVVIGVSEKYAQPLVPDYFHYPHLLQEHLCSDYTTSKTEPLKVTTMELNDELCGRLVEIEGLSGGVDGEQWGSDKPYLFTIGASGELQIGVRVSPYADFAQTYIPKGIFSVRGVLYREFVDGKLTFIVKPRSKDDII